MFSELDNRIRFSPDYGSMADTIFHPSSHASDFNNYDLESSPYSSNSDDFPDCEGMIDFNDDDILLSPYGNYDIERHPQLLSLVPPNEILPVEPAISLDSLQDPYLRTNFGNEIFTFFPNFNEYDDLLNVPDTPSTAIPESLEQMYTSDDQLVDDKILNEMVEDCTSLENIEEELLPFFVQTISGSSSSSNSSSSSSSSSSSNNNNDDGDAITMSRRTYHPDYDHCYSKLNEDKEDVWTSMGSPDSSGSSSEEVDVVTVTEELKAPFVPKVQVPFRKRQKRGQKSQKGKKNSLSHKTFNAAIKRSMTRITTIRRTYRRKINNSVETTPSNSLPSSAPSSRCSSDVEDAGKRANHNSSERKRREVLRTALQTLRQCVPGVQNNPKAPKVQILNTAKEFIREMKLKDQECVVIKKNLKSKKKSLEMKLKSLAAELKLL